MDRVQDIQISDASLKAQYISYFVQGNYAAMSQLLVDNPQLDSKVFVASVINDVVNILSTLQNNYNADIPQYLAVLTTELNARIGQFNDLEEWSNDVEYSLYNFVDYNNDVYMYINDNPTSSNAPTDTTYWLLIGLRGAQGAPGLGLNLRFAWNNIVQYNALDLVFYEDSSWVAVYDNTNEPPSESSQYWFRFVQHEPVGIETSQTQLAETYLGQIWFNIKE